ncbi:MAG: DNA-dependent RNA polymerase auxiliary subunit epsilon family protein [Streptococcaceae bacterium]|jgi:DNA-dependent RNA polymerase auxiliary subunit epsilon|nr:DNA-dependent RNA polymerase auxiliary subunit epsilon family protein [Streptococcaceae bacterium]
MLFKVFYQESKKRSPKREATHALFLEIDAASYHEGIIKARDLIREHTAYHVEYIDAISAEQAAYEKETTGFDITHF